MIIHHQVARGDTLWGIAQQYDTTIDAIKAANSWIVNPDHVEPGWVFHIPVADPTPEFEDGADITAMIIDRFAAGATRINIPAGTFTVTDALVMPNGGSLVGAGWDVTRLDVRHAGHGLIVSKLCKVADLTLVGRNPAPDQDGILIHGRTVIVDTVHATGFGRDGIHVDGASGINSNLVNLSRIRSTGNGRNGVYIHGLDGNNGYITRADVVGNGRWGIHSQGAKTTFMAVHASRNGQGAIYENGKSNTWIAPYVEGGVGSDVVFGSNSNYQLWLDTLYGATLPRVVGNGGAGATVLTRGSLFPHSIMARRKINLADANGGPTWSLRVDRNGNLSTVGPNTPKFWFPEQHDGSVDP